MDLIRVIQNGCHLHYNSGESRSKFLKAGISQYWPNYGLFLSVYSYFIIRCSLNYIRYRNVTGKDCMKAYILGQGQIQGQSEDQN